MLKQSRDRRKRGFVLIATCIVLVLLLAAAGLGIDIGRMYVIKSELQAYADAAALSAAKQLDGSDRGLAQAREAVKKLATGPNAMKWDMGTKPVDAIVTSFATGDELPDQKSWQSEPKSASGYRFVRVVVSAPAPLIFLRAFQTITSESTNVAASSVASATRLVE